MPTARVQLKKDAWTNLGSGPMFLQSKGPEWPVYWCVSASDPGTNAPGDIADLPQHVLGGAGAPADVNVGFTQTVWARGRGTVTVSS